MSIRWSAWIALLVAEVLVLSVCFDTGALQGDRRWWAELLGHSAEALRLGGAAAAATLLVGAAGCAARCGVGRDFAHRRADGGPCSWAIWPHSPASSG